MAKVVVIFALAVVAVVQAQDSDTRSLASLSASETLDLLKQWELFDIFGEVNFCAQFLLLSLTASNSQQ